MPLNAKNEPGLNVIGKLDPQLSELLTDPFDLFDFFFYNRYKRKAKIHDALLHIKTHAALFESLGDFACYACYSLNYFRIFLEKLSSIEKDPTTHLTHSNAFIRKYAQYALTQKKVAQYALTQKKVAQYALTQKKVNIFTSFFKRIFSGSIKSVRKRLIFSQGFSKYLC